CLPWPCPRAVFGPPTEPSLARGDGSLFRSLFPMSTPAQLTGSHALAFLQAAFVAVLPRIVTHGRLYFRHVKCPATREEAVAEMVALAWQWYARLAHRGKDAGQFISTLADYAARAVNSGRRLTGMEATKDVL